MADLFARLLPGRRKKPPFFCTAVVAAAGSATRMEGQDKLMAPLGGEPVIAHTLRALECCALIREIIVVTREDLILPMGQICKDYSFTKVKKIILGGETRAQSVYAGICEADPMTGLIAIHDGARPFVSIEVLEGVILKAAECGAAAPAIALKDTVKEAYGRIVERTPDRESLFAVQTPQVFEASLIKAALHKAIEDGIELTDDCAAAERLGMKVVLTAGSEENLKITTPVDLCLAEAVLDWRDGR